MAAAAAAVIMAAPAPARTSPRLLSDHHVGTSRTELLAQRVFSSREISRLTHDWRFARHHANCWAHVPWAKQCDRVRLRVAAHRWLLSVANHRLAQMGPRFPAWWLAQAACIHSREGAWNDNTGNTYFGGMQFLPSTWLRAGGAYVAAFDHPGNHAYPFTVSPQEQLHRAWRIWKQDGGSWREWGTAGACGLR